jgi:hypothetical protein
MLAGSSFFSGAINPRDIETVIRSMNEMQIERSARGEADKRNGEPPLPAIRSD